MCKGHIYILLVMCVAVLCDATTPVPASQLKCRVCHAAQDLADCNYQATCDVNEVCYMEQSVTEMQTVIYNAGCRSRDVCTKGLPVVGRRDVNLVACSRCCENIDDCNAHLCGIPNPTANISQCYYCDHLRNPSCQTFTTCQSDEVCLTQTTWQGSLNYKYGCMGRQICQLLMREVFRDLDVCSGNSDPALCGGLSASCVSCCGYGGCNYGTCREQNERLYAYYKANVLDMNTLKPIY